MNSASARRLILGSVAATATLAGVRWLVTKGTPPLRLFIGALLVAAVLAMAAELAPEPAAALAVLIFLGALVALTPETFGAVNKSLTAGMAGDGSTPYPGSGSGSISVRF